MKRSCLTLAALTSIFALAACESKSDPAKAEPAPVAAADPDANLPTNKKLALAKATGSTGADKAITDAQTQVRANMAKDDLWVVLGRAWVRKARESNDPGFYLNADACADVVLQKIPDNKLALDLRGLVLLNGHKFEDARALAEKVVKKNPDDPMAWGNMHDALLELGRYDEATDAAQKMVDLKPNLPSYSRASYLQWVRNDVPAAKQTVRAALDAGRAAKSDPEPGAWVLVQAAMIFWHEGDYEGADAGCDKSLERLSDYAPANVCKGRVAMAKGDSRRAAELFERAYKVSPLAETAWLMGDAYEANGRADKAAESYALVEKEGKRTDPRTYSLFLSTKNKNAEEALKLAREEFNARKDIYTEDALAWALYRAGKLDEAKTAIVHARRLNTPDARLMYHEGAIRLAAGDAKGKELIAKAMKMNKAFDYTAMKEAEKILAAPVATR